MSHDLNAASSLLKLSLVSECRPLADVVEREGSQLVKFHALSDKPTPLNP